MTTLDTIVEKLHELPLPAGWRMVPLGDVCSVPVAHRDPSREPDSQFRYIDISSIDTRVKHIVDAKILYGREAPSRARQLVHSQDVLVATTRPNLNAVALVPGDLDHAIASTGFCVLRCNPDVHPEYLFYCVRSPLFVNALANITNGSTYPAVKDAQVRTQKIPLPPLPEQKRIAAALREQMAAVEKAGAAAQTRFEAANMLPAACLRSVFEGPGAAQWPMRPLGEVLVPHKEIIHPGDRQSGAATFVGLEHVESHTGRRTGSASLDLARLTGRKPTFRQGQIVYGYLRPYLNKVWIAEFDGCSSVDQFAYEVRSDLADVRFVAWFMRSPTYMRRSQVVTTTGQLPRIGIGAIASVEIGLPSLGVQRAVADRIDQRFAAHQRLCNLLREEAAAIESMSAALLRKAFSGKQ